MTLDQDIRRWLDVHEETSYVGGESTDFWEVHRYVGESGLLVCEETRIEDRCSGCTPDGADDDTAMSVQHPCPTLLALGVGGV